MPRLAPTAALVASVVATAAAAVIALPLQAAAADYKRVIDALETRTTNIGQPIHYPSGPLKISSLVVTMKPGEETGRHMHPVPTYGYLLQGEVTITYEGHGTKVYKAGDAFMEAMHTWHNGRATGDGETRILALFFGVDGVPNVIRP